MIEPDPESWTIERIMAILICMVVIEPFVVAVEWLYMNIFNAPIARTRSSVQLAHGAEQQQHVWKALARELEAHGGAMHGEEPRDKDEELGKVGQSRNRNAVRFVNAPVVPHGTSLGVTFASAAHGHAKAR